MSKSTTTDRMIINLNRNRPPADELEPDEWAAETSPTITGRKAIDFARANPTAILCKYADPIESALDDVSIESAEEIAAEDPALIYIVIGRDDAIEIAVAFLDANTYANYTRYSFADKGDNAQIVLVSDDDMDVLGTKLEGATDLEALNIYAEWTQGRGEYTTALEVATSFQPGEVTELAGLQEAAGAAGDYLTAAVCFHDARGLADALGLVSQ